MRIHSAKKIAKLKSLRKNGHSIESLVKILSMPKTTIWHHIQGIKLESHHVAKLNANGGLSSKLRKEKMIVKAEKEAKILLAGPHKYKCSILAMLYWAEGSNSQFNFTNTNVEMIKMFIRILETVFDVSSDRITVLIRYFTGMNKEKCLLFWQESLNLPKDNFTMYYNDGGGRGRSSFGICRVIVRRGGYMLKLTKALHRLISNEINAPVV